MKTTLLEALLLGVSIGAIVAITAVGLAKPNISETELLRFCMDKNIKRAECIIGKDHGDGK